MNVILLIPIDSGLPEHLPSAMQCSIADSVRRAIESVYPYVTPVIECSADVAAVHDVCVVLDELPPEFRDRNYRDKYIAPLLRAIRNEIQNKVKQLSREYNQGEEL